MNIRLIHADPAVSQQKAEPLRAAGFEVDAGPIDTQEKMKSIKTNPPDLFLIDLSRAPSHSLEIALYIRMSKPTRNTPIVFAGGEPDKVERVRSKLPDAVYTGWETVEKTIKRAIENPPADPVVPKSIFDGYSGTPLAKKLGIKEGMIVSVLDPPPDFINKMSDLPDEVKIENNISTESGLILWFVRSEKELSERITILAPVAPKGGLWIVWPKKTGSLRSDLTQVSVRKTGLDAGLVDYKVCSVDDDWSGLKFARRK